MSTNGPIENAPRMTKGMSAPEKIHAAPRHRLDALNQLIVTTIKPSNPATTQSTNINPGNGQSELMSTWA